MLKVSRESIWSAQDYAQKYVARHRREVIFEEGDRVFLIVPSKLETLRMGNCEKLLLKYCGPFTIIKTIGHVAYKLDLFFTYSKVL